MDPLHFSCTLCGQCCRNHSLPLTGDEAISWLQDKGVVAIYCEAIRALPEPLDARTEHRKKHGFEVDCGTSTMHVTAILAAINAGTCHNLGEDLKCRIYARRPLVCRVYPAEINPFIQLDTANKVCPPEAWPATPPDDDSFARDLPARAEESRQTDYREAARKGRLCEKLGVNTTALADEGYVQHVPDPARFLVALKELFHGKGPEAPVSRPAWRLYSPRLAQAASTNGLDVIAEIATGAGYRFLRA